MLAKISKLAMDLLILLYCGRGTQKKGFEIFIVCLLCPLHIKIKKRPKHTFLSSYILCF